MPGSSLSVSGPNVILNTAVADSLGAFADRLESPGRQAGGGNPHPLKGGDPGSPENRLQRQRIYGGLGKGAWPARPV